MLRAVLEGDTLSILDGTIILASRREWTDEQLKRGFPVMMETALDAWFEEDPDRSLTFLQAENVLYYWEDLDAPPRFGHDPR